MKDDFWPVSFRETFVDDTGALAQRHEILYPFIEIQRSESRRCIAVRPFGNYEAIPDDGLMRIQPLWPLGLISLREERGELYRLWPLFQHSVTHDFFSGQTTTHGWIFPVVYWGSMPERDPYRGLLPVAGRTYGIIGDEFSWVLFPVYSYYQHGQYRRHDVLWPLLSRGFNADGTQNTWRFWPLYVRKEKEDAFEHNYLLWPFLRWGHEEWDRIGGETMRRDYFAFHPFYGHQASRDAAGNVVARQRHVFLFNWTTDTRRPEEQTQWSALFSLVRRQNTDDVDEWRFFPVFQRKVLYPTERTEESSIVHHRLMWPFIWNTRDKSLPGRELCYTVFAPFLWHYTRHCAVEDATDKSTTFWPVLTVEHGREGSFALYILHHGWRDATGGYSRNYRPFFEFFRFRAHPDGSRETRLLWRLYHHERGPEGRSLSVNPLFRYESRQPENGERQRDVSFLLGLIRLESDEEGRRVLFPGQ